MQSHPLPNPQRLRQIPPQFSWVDHRLVRDGHFERCSCEAMALYLFLLTVADARGLSYYAQPSLMKQLSLGTQRFMQARKELIEAGLIAWQHPLYQVLALEPGGAQQESSPPQNHPVRQSAGANRPLDVKRILKQLRGGRHD